MTPEEKDILMQRIAELEFKLNFFVYADRYQFQRPVKFSGNKIGFFNIAPVVQQAAISSPTGGGTIDGNARAAINSLITTLKNLGLTL